MLDFMLMMFLFGFVLGHMSNQWLWMRRISSMLKDFVEKIKQPDNSKKPDDKK